MYCGSGTVDRVTSRQPVDAAVVCSSGWGRRCLCTQQIAALFCVKWRHGRCLESIPYYQNSTRQSMKNNPAKFHPDLIWNDGALGFFEDSRPTIATRWVAIWDQFLIHKNFSWLMSISVRWCTYCVSAILCICVCYSVVQYMYGTYVSYTVYFC